MKSVTALSPRQYGADEDLDDERRGSLCLYMHILLFSLVLVVSVNDILFFVVIPGTTS